MTTASDRKSSASRIRTGLGVGGALAILCGILIIAWPSKTAIIVTAIIAVYAIVTGLVYASIGALSNVKGGWSRIGQVVLGILFVFAGLLAFTNLAQTTSWLAVFLGILVGIMWIIEGIVALSTLGDASSKAWSIVFAVIGIVAGITVMFSPLWGAAVLWWLLGVSLIVLGVMNVGRAVTYSATSNRPH